MLLAGMDGVHCCWKSPMFCLPIMPEWALHGIHVNVSICCVLLLALFIVIAFVVVILLSLLSLCLAAWSLTQCQLLVNAEWQASSIC